MHDREDLRLFVIGDFIILIIGEETRHIRIAFKERINQIGMQHGIELARDQHFLDIFVVGQAGELQIIRRYEFDIFVDFRKPFAALMRHAIFMFQNATQPEDRRDLIGFHADLFADEIFGRFNALVRIDEDEAVAEAAMQEDGQRIDRKTLIARDEIGRGGEFGHIKLAIAQKAPMPCRGILLGHHGELNAIGLDRALFDRAHDFIIAAGHCEMDIARHFGLSPHSCYPVLDRVSGRAGSGMNVSFPPEALQAPLLCLNS